MVDPATRNIPRPDGIAVAVAAGLPSRRARKSTGKPMLHHLGELLLQVGLLQLAPFRRDVERLPLDLACGEKVVERLDPAHVDLQRDRRRLVGEHERLHEVDPVLREREALRQQPLTQVGRARGRARTTMRTACRPAPVLEPARRGRATSSSPTFTPDTEAHVVPCRTQTRPSSKRETETPSGSCVKRSGSRRIP